MSSEDDQVIFNVPEGYFYSMEPEAVWFTMEELGESNKFKFPLKKIAVLSTGLSYNLVPSSY